MLTRAIHCTRYIFDAMYLPTLIPNNGIVFFTHVSYSFYTPITVGGTISAINRIDYYNATGKFVIRTSSNTYNDFMINWSVCIRSCMTNQMPCFAVVVRNSDNSIYDTFPSSGARRTACLYGNCILHLPTPDPSIPEVSYTLTLENQTGGDCFYNQKQYVYADMLIVCLSNT